MRKSKQQNLQQLATVSQVLNERSSSHTKEDCRGIDHIEDQACLLEYTPDAPLKVGAMPTTLTSSVRIDVKLTPPELFIFWLSTSLREIIFNGGKNLLINREDMYERSN